MTINKAKSAALMAAIVVALATGSAKAADIVDTANFRYFSSSN